MEEVWKDIEGYEGIYQVSSLGRVRSLDRVIVKPHPRNTSMSMSFVKKSRILKQKQDRSGYCRVMLYDNFHQPIQYLVHRLVAIAFLSNQDNLPFVNHKDEKPQNNHVDNLEWCTCKYNNTYGTARIRGGRNHWVPVVQMSLNGEVIKVWPSVVEAEKGTSIPSTSIVKVCRGKRKYSGGFRWRYAESKPRRPF